MGFNSLYINGKELKDLSIDGNKIWEKEQPPVVELDNFYIQPLANNAEIALAQLSAVSVDLQWTVDGETWTQLDGTNPITGIRKNQKVYFKTTTGNNRFGYATSSTTTTFKKGRYFTCTTNFKIGGHITSLLASDFLNYQLVAANGHCFAYLFAEQENIVSASDLIMPTNTQHGCFGQMFYKCTNLVDAPSLPATELSNYCYYNMFYHCDSLLYAPELPATEAKQYCYGYMFYYCTSLSNHVRIRLTTLAAYCCYYMFYHSSVPAVTIDYAGEMPKLTKIFQSMFASSDCKEIHVNFTTWYDTTQTTAALRPTYNWVSSIVSKTGDFYCPSALPQEFGVNRIPTGWTVHTT